MKRKILIVIGTRPEAIKMAPLIRELQRNDFCELHVCVTAQHRKMLDQVLEAFVITPDYDLNIMSQNQTLSQITQKILTGIEDIFTQFMPDIVLVHGDTTTSFAAALSAFYHKIPVGHVEAGLRTYDMYSPFPEEMNRQLTGRISKFHFAPTPRAAENLVKESVPQSRIIITGNTVIDSVKMINEKIDSNQAYREELESKFNYIETFEKMVLITLHRRENLEGKIDELIESFLELAKRRKRDLFIFPVHPNPLIHQIAHERLKNISNIKLVESLDYPEFIFLMKKCYLMLTDSGGIQEEGPYFKKPVLVMREHSERVEAVEAGTALIVGTEKNAIVDTTIKLFEDAGFYETFQHKKNPFGEGNASLVITQFLKKYFSDN